ncbi:small conductance mechanosensitive channel [Kineococcus xinjiangensis]|uniref:Small conductance mechanosensitive channel n=1 Tax=Kineococcus xinjiangensis TaxID=512762 RepID=A0A2S6IJ46_9ACTN|nr:mechanosensitive ion channel family protein [Kineococcus xinjiangensis]PPK94205.1 small conductance mechanosensitive channel [Kineococcus xinjiangensis]
MTLAPTLMPTPPKPPGPAAEPESAESVEPAEALGALKAEVVGEECVRGETSVCGYVYDWTDNELVGRIAGILVDWPFKIALILLIGFVVRYLLMRVIDRVTTSISEGAERLGGGRRNPLLDSSPLLSERRNQRARTIGSVLKSVVTLLVAVTAGLMVLDTIGLPIGPFLASAGIAGVALGFGAQSLVKDFLSGIFMLAEDQYGVGDVVDVGDASGTVEAVGLRVTRLRDVNGTVWYVRNGEILRVGNQSQGWARAVLDVAVAYEEDVARVSDLLERIGRRLAEDEDWKDLVLEEPEVWGVEQMAPDSVVLRVVVKTAPLEQWKVAREMRRRIKAAFDAEGIEFPFPQRTVWLRQAEPGGAHPPVQHTGDSAEAAPAQPPPSGESRVAKDLDAAAARGL